MLRAGELNPDLEGIDLDARKNILFIGANNMNDPKGELNYYIPRYKHGIFIEAIPFVYKQLKSNLEKANKQYNTNYIPINKLVTSKSGEEHQFNVFTGRGRVGRGPLDGHHSSSLYKPNNDLTGHSWGNLHVDHEITLISTTIENLIKENNWSEKKYDVVLDVQGAELVVLNGFGMNNLKNICELRVEISKRAFYNGGVLFTELNDFLIKNGFKIVTQPHCDHCDATYIRE